MIAPQGATEIGKTLSPDGFPVYSGTWWKLALPHFILPLYIAVMLVLLAVGALRPGASWLGVAGGALSGYGLWTLFEYILHRWLLHHMRRPLLRRIFWKGLHEEHHRLRQMEDLDHHGIHPAISLPIVFVIVAAVALPTRSGFGFAAGAGWVFGYFGYEGLHWVFHSCTPGRGVLRARHLQWLYEAHEVHHLRNSRRNYGFVTMFWDRVFGTYEPVE